jgi:oligoribonuclease
MTGLDPLEDRIIEIATIVTDKQLNVLEEGPSLVIHQDRERMLAMDEWNTRQHAESGLTERVLQSRATLAEAEAATIDFLSEWTEAGVSPMCGNSICQDRRFLAREMPALERHFHYRNLDVSSFKIVAELWSPGLAGGFRKASTHRALSDIRDSIAELAWYREHLLDADAIKRG